MRLSIGFSPCPNDTFMFHALTHQIIDCEGITFQVHMADIEQLNQMAAEGVLDISKISIGAYADVADKYALLHSGSALGFKNGPLLVSKKRIYPDEVKHLNIGIPGLKTTANLLLSILYPEIASKKEYLFSDIEEAVLSEEVDAGLIIHESRFTYHEKGLKKVIDLGEAWERVTNLPIPLGSIAIKRHMDEDIKQKINRVISKSIQYGVENPKESIQYIKRHARELGEVVIRRHIDLYVNEFSGNLGDKGRKAITHMLQKGYDAGVLPKIENEIFINI